MLAELMPMLIPAAILIALSLGTSLLFLAQYRLAGRVSSQVRVATAVVVIGIGAVLSVALTTRNLDESVLTAGRTVLYEDYAGGFAASRWLSLLLLAAAVVEIFRGWVRRRGARQSDPAWPLLAALLLFYSGTLVVQGFLSEHVGFSYRELYLPIILLAAYYQPVRDFRLIFSAAKWAILALTLGSLIGIFVRPDFVLHRPAPGVIPGIDWRLFGLATHANTLGPVALLGILLELYSPSRSRWLRTLHLSAACAVFVLAQSRTAWVAGVLIFIVVQLPRALVPKPGSADQQGSFTRSIWALLVCIALVIVGVFGLAALSGTDYLQRKTDIGTLNGRFQIWDITLEAWRENVLFGYGPEVWSPQRRLQFNMFGVGQAHNQFVQTLGEAGLLGLALLIVYLLTLLGIACRYFGASRGLIMALLLLLLARCVTESPLRSEGVLSWATFLHVLLLLAACQYLRQPRRQPSQQTIRSASSERQGSATHRFAGTGMERLT